jgi:hypothetical protein
MILISALKAQVKRNNRIFWTETFMTDKLPPFVKDGSLFPCIFKWSMTGEGRRIT